MADGADDQSILIKGAEDLSDYLSSTVLFWRLQAESQPLTIGNLLLARKKVAALYPDTLPGNVKSAFLQLERTRAERPAAWQNKADAELHSRLNQYQTLIDELDKGGYGVIARLRAILELLLSEVSDPAAAGVSLSGLDERLKVAFESGDFIWPEVYQSSFPKEKFWFLYGKTRDWVEK